MLKKSSCEPVFVNQKFSVVVRPGSVVLSAGVERVAAYSENRTLDTLICCVSVQPSLPLKITDAVKVQTPENENEPVLRVKLATPEIGLFSKEPGWMKISPEYNVSVSAEFVSSK